MEAKELYIGMSDEALAESVRAALEVARERQLEIPGIIGSLATDLAYDSGSTPPETISSAPETAKTVNRYDDTAALKALSPERRGRAADLKAALAEKFSSSERTLSAKDFGVVLVGEGKAQKAVVLLTSGNGLYTGSYNAIMGKSKSNRADYMIEVGAQAIDSRKSMTWELYAAFIDSAKTQGLVPLPDCAPLANEYNQPWTSTWLTGEKAGDFIAFSGYVSFDVADRLWDLRYRDWSVLRFRPSAEV